MKIFNYIFSMIILSFVIIVVFPIDQHVTTKLESPYLTEIDVLLNKDVNKISDKESERLSELIIKNNLWFESQNKDSIFTRFWQFLVSSSYLVLALLMLWGIGFFLFININRVRHN